MSVTSRGRAPVFCSGIAVAAAITLVPVGANHTVSGEQARTETSRRLWTPWLTERCAKNGYPAFRWSLPPVRASCCRKLTAWPTLKMTFVPPTSAAATDLAAPQMTPAPTHATWACPRCGAAMTVGAILSVLQLATAAVGFDTS
jgi:hypothetical protein